MNVMQPPPYKAGDYKSDITPVWCPGCGDFHVLLSLTKALAELGTAPEDVAVVSGHAGDGLALLKSPR